MTALPVLETATETWTNVNLINYTPGTTNISDNAKTVCTRNSCDENIYTMKEQSARSDLHAYAWIVDYYGNIDNVYTISTDREVRAVININK